MKTITHKDARDKIFRSLLYGCGIAQTNIRGASSDHLSIDFSKGVWADSVTLYINERLRLGDADEPTKVTYSIELNWSGSGRSIAGASVAIANYRRALEVAIFVNAILEELPTVVYEPEVDEVSS